MRGAKSRAAALTETEREQRRSRPHGMLEADSATMRLHFVAGLAVSAVTTAFLEWLCQQIAAQDQCTLLLIWAMCAFHVSKQVKTWIRQHNQTALETQHQGKQAVRLIPYWLPIKSQQLNRIEAQRVHSKQAIVELVHLFTTQEVIVRVGHHFNCEQLEPLAQQVA